MQQVNLKHASQSGTRTNGLDVQLLDGSTVENIRYYNKFIGFFAILFCLATKFKCNGKIYYINTNSFAKRCDPRGIDDVKLIDMVLAVRKTQNAAAQMETASLSHEEYCARLSNWSDQKSADLLDQWWGNQDPYSMNPNPLDNLKFPLTKMLRIVNDPAKIRPLLYSIMSTEQGMKQGIEILDKQPWKFVISSEYLKLKLKALKKYFLFDQWCDLNPIKGGANKYSGFAGAIACGSWGGRWGNEGSSLHAQLAKHLEEKEWKAGGNFLKKNPELNDQLLGFIIESSIENLAKYFGSLSKIELFAALQNKATKEKLLYAAKLAAEPQLKELNELQPCFHDSKAS